MDLLGRLLVLIKDLADRLFAHVRQVFAGREQSLESGARVVLDQDLGTPDELDPRQVIVRAFAHLRRRGVILGIGELQAALQAVEGGWGTGDQDELVQVAQLLWCNSYEQRLELEMVWALTVSELSRQSLSEEEPEPISTTPFSETPEPPSTPPPTPPPPASKQEIEEPSPAPEWGTLPIRAPFVPAPVKERVDIRTYWPVSRRFMVYAWRYLRRPIPDGPRDVLDVEATVKESARQGYYLAPVYRRRERNYAHLVLFLDQGGSMVPFHRYVRDLVETAQGESTIRQVDAFYFHNVPATKVYLDPHMTTAAVPLKQVLAQCSTDTSVLVVSDAGAARGVRRLGRIRQTTKFLAHLKQYTPLIAWLNPMPVERWEGTSAQIIAHLVPMQEMSPDGFSNAIDVIRGQPLYYYR